MQLVSQHDSGPIGGVYDADQPEAEPHISSIVQLSRITFYKSNNTDFLALKLTGIRRLVFRKAAYEDADPAIKPEGEEAEPPHQPS